MLGMPLLGSGIRRTPRGTDAADGNYARNPEKGEYAHAEQDEHVEKRRNRDTDTGATGHLVGAKGIGKERRKGVTLAGSPRLRASLRLRLQGAAPSNVRRSARL